MEKNALKTEVLKVISKNERVSEKYVCDMLKEWKKVYGESFSAKIFLALKELSQEGKIKEVPCGESGLCKLYYPA